MNCKSTLAIRAALSLALLASVNVSRAQFGGADQYPTQNLSRDIVFQGSRTISGNTIAIVAAKVAQNLRGEDEGKPGAVSGIQMLNSVALHTGSGMPVDYGSGVDNEPEIRGLYVTVRIADDGTELPADEMAAIWEKARRALEDGLRKLQATTRQNQIHKRERDIQSSREALESCRSDYERTIAQLSAAESVLGDGTQAEIQQQLTATLAELRQLRLKMIGLQARRGAIEGRVDELREVAEKAAVNDPVIDELERIVAIRTDFVQMMRERQEVGTAQVTGMDVQGAEAQLAEARIQLLKAQREAAQLSQGDALLQLNNELSMLIIQSAELEATLKATEELAAELRVKASTERWSEMDLLRGRLDLAKSRLQAAEQAVFERENQPLPPLEEISIRPLDDVLAPESEPAAP